MIRKISAILLVMTTILATTIMPTNAIANTYTPALSDISNHWAKVSIYYLVEKGGITGYSDGTFKPDKIITYAEFLKIALCVATGKAYASAAGEHWAMGVYNEAVKLGIVTSAEMDVPDFDKAIPREDMALILVRVNQKIFGASDVDITGVQGKIADYSSISKDRAAYVLQAYRLGFLEGSNGYFSPSSSATRAQAAQVMYRLLVSDARIDYTTLRDVRDGDTEVIVVSNITELMATESSTKKGNVTVLIKDGEYKLSKGLCITGDNVTYASYSGKRDAVILNGDFSASHIFWVMSDNVTIKDMTLGRVNNHAIQIHGELDADNTVVKNVRFFDIKEQFIKGSFSQSSVSYSDDCIVEDCFFEFTGNEAFQYYTGGIDVHRGKNWIVRNNTFRNIQRISGALTEGAIHFWSASEGTLVEGNIIINCDRGIMLGFDNSPHYNGVVKNNFVQTSRDVGIYICTSQNTKVYNNTVFSYPGYSNSIEYRFSTMGTMIINNLTNGAISSRDGGTATLENNISSADRTWFVNADKGDLHLSENASSSVDRGKDLLEVSIDIDGELRESGKYNVGADET